MIGQPGSGSECAKAARIAGGMVVVSGSIQVPREAALPDEARTMRTLEHDARVAL